MYAIMQPSILFPDYSVLTHSVLARSATKETLATERDARHYFTTTFLPPRIYTPFRGCFVIRWPYKFQNFVGV